MLEPSRSVLKHSGPPKANDIRTLNICISFYAHYHLPFYLSCSEEQTSHVLQFFSSFLHLFYLWSTLHTAHSSRLLKVKSEQATPQYISQCFACPKSQAKGQDGFQLLNDLADIYLSCCLS